MSAYLRSKCFLCLDRIVGCWEQFYTPRKSLQQPPGLCLLLPLSARESFLWSHRFHHESKIPIFEFLVDLNINNMKWTSCVINTSCKYISWPHLHSFAIILEQTFTNTFIGYIYIVLTSYDMCHLTITHQTQRGSKFILNDVIENNAVSTF